LAAFHNFERRGYSPHWWRGGATSIAGFHSNNPDGLSIAGIRNGHYPPVLRPWKMVHVEGAASDDICILERLITRLVEPVRSAVLMDIVACGVAMCRIVGGEPKVVPNESRTSNQARVFLRESPNHVHFRHDL